jgi:hypothetical protein
MDEHLPIYATYGYCVTVSGPNNDDSTDHRNNVIMRYMIGIPKQQARDYVVNAYRLEYGDNYERVEITRISDKVLASIPVLMTLVNSDLHEKQKGDRNNMIGQIREAISILKNGTIYDKVHLTAVLEDALKGVE